MSNEDQDAPKPKQRPRIEVSAGAIVFKRMRRGVFIAMTKDSYGKWTFPKGHVRRGESFSEAAARECAEETGITQLRRIKKLGSIDIWFRDRFVYKGRLIHKFIHYYLFEAPANARVRIPKSPEQGEKIQDVKWVPIASVEQMSAYDDLVQILTKALKRIRSENKRYV